MGVVQMTHLHNTLIPDIDMGIVQMTRTTPIVSLAPPAHDPL